MPTDNKKKTLVLDFDGVLHSYTSGWQGPDIIPDPPVPGAMAFLVHAQAKFAINIFSSRSAYPDGVRAMQSWLFQHLTEADCSPAVAYDMVHNRIQWPLIKPSAHVTIDDRALTFIGEWPSIDSLLEFKPWHQKKENNQK